MSAEPASQPSDATVPPAPGVSVVLPVLDEEPYLRAAVERILEQRYPGPFEVVLAIGPSKDATAEIAARLAEADPRVRVVDNPSGRTPAGLNRAIAAARHDVLVRVDGHAEISDDYVATCVELLGATGAANVGGMMVPVGRTPLEQAVACAMSSPLGIGPERFHTGGEAGPANTVYLGAFRRDALARVGGFDESFVRAQDWELNHRLRLAGETVWFDPRLAVTYRPRGSWRALARQFYRTGRWRREVVRRYPQTANVRYLAPPVTVVAVGAGTLAALAGAVGPRWLLLGALAPGGYLALVLGGALVAGRGLPASAWARLPGVLATMHLTWGLGFVRGVPRQDRGEGSRSQVHYPEAAQEQSDSSGPSPSRPRTTP